MQQSMIMCLTKNHLVSPKKVVNVIDWISWCREGLSEQLAFTTI